MRGNPALCCGLYNSDYSRGYRGVAIMLYPKFFSFYEEASGLPPVTTSQNHDDSTGKRHVEINPKIMRIFKQRRVDFRKKGK